MEINEKKSKEKLKAIAKVIKDELAKMPPFIIEKSDEYDRITLNPDLLNNLFDDSLDYFTVDELRKLDLSAVDFSGKDISGINFSYTNVRIDPQKVMRKILSGTNLEGLDLSAADFDGVGVIAANLKGTGAKIDPQKVKQKNLFLTNLEGLDLSTADFDGVDICAANLKGTGAKIDPQKVSLRRLIRTNLEGLDLSAADFDGVDICAANLKDTSALIDPKKTFVNEDTNLSGCYALVSSFDIRNFFGMRTKLPYNQCTLVKESDLISSEEKNAICEQFEKHRQKTIGPIGSFRK